MPLANDKIKRFFNVILLHLSPTRTARVKLLVVHAIGRLLGTCNRDICSRRELRRPSTAVAYQMGWHIAHATPNKIHVILIFAAPFQNDATPAWCHPSQKS